MALTKEVVIDQITADEHGNLMYREATRIMEDDKELSKSYHRSSLSPGADLTGVDPKVATMARATWTPEIIAPLTDKVKAACAALKTEIAAHEAAKSACEIACAEAEAAKVKSEAAKAAADLAAQEAVAAQAAPVAVFRGLS
jgi:regulator of protease activity HflC (stomatin/prohibitin superfamily)